MRNTGTKKTREARRLLGEARLRAFLRHLRAESDILACGLVNEALDAGTTLDAIFELDEGFGYNLSASRLGERKFRICFGCQAAPEAGDGGEWAVDFDAGGEISAVIPEGRWVS